MQMIDIKLLAMQSEKKFPFGDFSGIDIDIINKFEQDLNLNLSTEFKVASVEYNYCLFSFGFFSFPEGVLQETLRLRQNANLPLNTLILSEDDASVLLMKCLGDHEEIYWIAIEDYENYCEGKPLEYDPNIFPTFTDFFAYLLDEEEKRRAEESK